MTRIQQKPFHCPAAKARVVLTRQIDDVSGLGDSGVQLSKTYGCSQEQDCPHQYQPSCEVRRRNGG